MSHIYLKSGDQVFGMTVKAAQLSQTIQNLLKGFGKDVTFFDENNPVPLHSIAPEILQKVIEWCEHHATESEPVDGAAAGDPRSESVDTISGWAKEFLNAGEKSVLNDLEAAANSLQVTGLLKAVHIINGQSMATTHKGIYAEIVRHLNKK